jgi:hypothetical protein
VFVLRLPDVCILSPRQTKINRFINKDIEVFPKDAFYQRKRREKRLREFLAGYRFLVDSVAIGVSLSPLRPVLARFFPLDERDCMGEFMHKRIDLPLHRLIV